MNNKYVQYGCGLCAPSNWRNFDASPTLRLQKLPLIGSLFCGNEYPIFPKNVEYGDIVNGLPIQAESCRAIYCSHILEYLAVNDFRIALRNTHSYLMKEGIFRLVLPDLETLVKAYIRNEEWNASILFMENSCLGKKVRSKGLKGFLREWLGNSSHLWMWDFKAINVELKSAGFREIRRAQFGNSKDQLFNEVEDARQWNNCLGVECIK